MFMVAFGLFLAGIRGIWKLVCVIFYVAGDDVMLKG